MRQATAAPPAAIVPADGSRAGAQYEGAPARNDDLTWLDEPVTELPAYESPDRGSAP